MEVTTAALIRADFIAQVRGITPAHALDDGAWKEVDQWQEVAGRRARLFFVMVDPGSDEDEDAPYGDGIPWSSTVQVWTNYIGTEAEIDGAIPSDGRQLYTTLEARLDPELAGLFQVDYDGWTAEDDQPGHVWGFHSLTVRYLVADV